MGFTNPVKSVVCVLLLLTKSFSGNPVLPEERKFKYMYIATFIPKVDRVEICSNDSENLKSHVTLDLMTFFILIDIEVVQQS